MEHEEGRRMTIDRMFDTWIEARAEVNRLLAEMETVPGPEALALDARVGDHIADTGGIEDAMAAKSAGGVEDIARKLAAGVTFAHEMAWPDDPGPGWPLILSALRDLLTMAPAVAATAGLAGVGPAGLPAPLTAAA